MTIKKFGIDGMIEWDEKFEDGREGYRKAGPSAEKIERGHSLSHKKRGYGLCDSCTNFSLTESNDTTLRARCVGDFGEKRTPISKVFPITRCTSYWSTSWLTYPQLKRMAWTIEIKKG